MGRQLGTTPLPCTHPASHAPLVHHVAGGLVGVEQGGVGGVGGHHAQRLVVAGNGGVILLLGEVRVAVGLELRQGGGVLQEGNGGGGDGWGRGAAERRQAAGGGVTMRHPSRVLRRQYGISRHAEPPGPAERRPPRRRE